VQELAVLAVKALAEVETREAAQQAITVFL